MTAGLYRTARVPCCLGLAGLGLLVALSPPPVLAQSRTEFARLVQFLSEEGGTFPSDNLISNELTLPEAAEALVQLRIRGGTYIGVGPEQNFTYISKVRPEWAFIVDLRRDNTLQHLIYKALFLKTDSPASFLSLLLSRDCRQLSESEARRASLAAVIECLDKAPTSQEVFECNLRQILKCVEKQIGFPLDEKDCGTLRRIYQSFFEKGLDIRYEFPVPGISPCPTLRDLLLAGDSGGRLQHFLVSKGAFDFVKGLQERDRIIPVTGDFAGKHALRRIGSFVRDHGSRARVFYLSNVEQYLRRETYAAFVENVRNLPLSEDSVLIRFYFGEAQSALMANGKLSEFFVIQRARSFLKLYDAGSYWSYRDLMELDHLDWRRRGK